MAPPMMTMTPQQALLLLDHATQPQNQGRIDRGGYVQVQLALETLAKLIPAPSAPEAGQTDLEAAERLA